MNKLVLIRHGQSEWNKRNLFTGWVDVPLSKEGIEEAVNAGKIISHIPFDSIYTSTLMRAQMTLMIAMLDHSSGKTPVIIHDEKKLQEWGQIYSEATLQQTIPVYCSPQLNERYYGELQGLNKNETVEKYGAEQVKIWRRSFNTPPPSGESLEMTAQRTIPYFERVIVPQLKKGQNILVSAHGNSLRSIIMDIESLSEHEVLHLELATGVPIVYEFNHGKFLKTLHF